MVCFGTSFWGEKKRIKTLYIKKELAREAHKKHSENFSKHIFYGKIKYFFSCQNTPQKIVLIIEKSTISLNLSPPSLYHITKKYDVESVSYDYSDNDLSKFQILLESSTLSSKPSSPDGIVYTAIMRSMTGAYKS